MKAKAKRLMVVFFGKFAPLSQETGTTFGLCGFRIFFEFLVNFFKKQAAIFARAQQQVHPRDMSCQCIGEKITLFLNPARLSVTQRQILHALIYF